jgi:hypothetical protein
VNSRRLAERLWPSALKRAGRRTRSCDRTTARSHAKARSEVEDLLKAGQIRGLVAPPRSN